MRHEVEYVHDHIHSCTKKMKKKLSFEIQSISYEE
jgi:hypothetical protein